MKISQRSARLVKAGQRICPDTVKICCQYKVTQEVCIDRTYTCDIPEFLSYRSSTNAQFRPIMEPGGDSTTGCPMVTCWEKVAITQQKQQSYYDVCNVSDLTCSDSTDGIPELTEINDGTNYDEFGKIRSQSITCVIFVYEIIPQDTITYTGETISISRQYTEIGETHVTYSPCTAAEQAVIPAPTC